MWIRRPINRGIGGLLSIALLVSVTAPCLSSDTVVVRAGRQVVVRFTEKIELRDIPEGGQFHAVMETPLRASGLEALSAGAKVTFEVGDVESPGRLGKGGKAQIKSIKALAVDGSEVPLQGLTTRRGSGKRFLAIVLIPVVFIGFFIKGSPAKFEPGETLSLEVASDTPVTVD